MDGIYYVDQPANVEFVGDGVKLRFTSGERTLTIVMARSKFRACVENGKRVLDEAERDELAKIRPFKC